MAEKFIDRGKGSQVRLFVCGLHTLFSPGGHQDRNHFLRFGNFTHIGTHRCSACLFFFLVQDFHQFNEIFVDYQKRFGDGKIFRLHIRDTDKFPFIINNIREPLAFSRQENEPGVSRTDCFNPNLYALTIYRHFFPPFCISLSTLRRKFPEM